ncbi:MAG: DUF416 family protein [Bacteroidetes bacterium]|nr:DUF416 family protein [Bacteroidota bacterium]
MNFTDFNRLFDQKVHSLSRIKQLDLAIAVCKQLFPDYQQFYLDEQWGDPDLLLDGIAYCEHHLEQSPEHATVKRMQDQLLSVVPYTDDFDNATYALKAGVAVLETLDFLSDDDAAQILAVGTCLTDTIDFKIQEEMELTEAQINIHPMMVEARRFLLGK